MELKVFENYDLLSSAAAEMILSCIRDKPDALICFASGDTPKLTYRLAAEQAEKEGIDRSQCFFIGLDEWMGIPPQNSGSCHYFLHQYLFTPMRMSPSHVHLFNAMAADEEEECRKMNRIIEGKGGIDLMVVGVGMNGHIGFNEPGTRTDTLAHVVKLDEITQIVGQKYFTGTVNVSRGITVGLKQALQARNLLMLANGKKKAPVIKRAVEGEVSIHFPASLMRQHQNGVIMIDSEAASELEIQYK